MNLELIFPGKIINHKNHKLSFILILSPLVSAITVLIWSGNSSILLAKYIHAVNTNIGSVFLYEFLSKKKISKPFQSL